MAKGKGGLIALGLMGSAIAAFAWFGRKKEALERIDYSIKEVKIRLSGSTFLVKIDLLINNPSNEKLSFKSFDGTVYADNQKLGDVSIPNSTVIAPNTQTVVSLSSFIPANNIAQIFLNTLTEMKLPSKAILRGTLTVGRFKIPVDNTIDLTAPKTV